MTGQVPKPLSPLPIKHYHVFLASPGDVTEERQAVRQFFERYNRHTAQLWGVHFDVVDWENYATVGVGRPQELITRVTLDRFRDSLVLIVGVLAQRFGSPTGEADSGTEEEFLWALQSSLQTGYPEIKWFFKRVDTFISPPDPDAIAESLSQWKRVRAFREALKGLPIFFAEYSDSAGFRDAFENDLSRWLTASARPWIPTEQAGSGLIPESSAPRAYYETIERDYRRLDIAGIDNDRAFEIPLTEIYVRLRVIGDEDSLQEPDKASDSGPIDIQTALLRYPKLAIVGDPGSGKSTFLKYVAVILARSVLANNPAVVLAELGLQEPLPIPVFVSCWDLSDFLKDHGAIDAATLLAFLAERLNACGFPIASKDLDSLLGSGSCCLMFDGLDEVPTDNGRAAVSRLLEDCVRRFPRNRYLVTSRVRAYTGDTILKGEFTRCDVQPFDANDRALFLKNWIGLLFKIPPDQVLSEGSEAGREFESLTRGIEKSDRIRPLAVNPLLLTVIAIVHWNRKRLPEQRVELYDECVDVLLGQRKEAERVQLGRKTEAFDEFHELQEREERSWIRKRFAEIALHIQSAESNHDEASKSDVVKLLAPRFIDRGAAGEEQAEIRAALFLDRQELRSGLLVSRREQSYRFVHLTFQEYLSAWHLSNQEFSEVVSHLELRIRQHKWFETLQLLGSEWAKKSDEKLDRYLAWLLERRGEAIADRAPIIALCANIVKDTSGIAEVSPGTRRAFQAGVQGTLDVFRSGSGIPALTQLEILEALGQLGAAVKPHLINATKSSLFQVRCRAIDMLLPHLPDDDLFGMAHVMGDRSKEPIKTFVLSLVGRDPSRTCEWLARRKAFGEKATEALGELIVELRRRLDSEAFAAVVRHVFSKGKSYGVLWMTQPNLFTARTRFVPFLGRDDLTSAGDGDVEDGVRAVALGELAKVYGAEASTWRLIRHSAAQDKAAGVRAFALDLLVRGRGDWEEAWQCVRSVVAKDADGAVRIKGLSLLAAGRRDAVETWEQVRAAFTKDKDSAVRVAALRLLAGRQNAEARRVELLDEAVVNDAEAEVRFAALELLTGGHKDRADTWRLVREAATRDRDAQVRVRALELLVLHRKDEAKTWESISGAVSGDSDGRVRLRALEWLVDGRRELPETWQAVRNAGANERDPRVRLKALGLLVAGQKDAQETWELVRKAVIEGDDQVVRTGSLELLISGQMGAPEMRRIIRDVTTGPDVSAVRREAFLAVVRGLFSVGIERRLLSRDVDGLPPGLDPREAITAGRVRAVASKLRLSEEDVRQLYEQIARSLSDGVGMRLALEWKTADAE